MARINGEGRIKLPGRLYEKSSILSSVSIHLSRYGISFDPVLVFSFLDAYTLPVYTLRPQVLRICNFRKVCFLICFSLG